MRFYRSCLHQHTPAWNRFFSLPACRVTKRRCTPSTQSTGSMVDAGAWQHSLVLIWFNAQENRPCSSYSHLWETGSTRTDDGGFSFLPPWTTAQKWQWLRGLMRDSRQIFKTGLASLLQPLRMGQTRNSEDAYEFTCECVTAICWAEWGWHPFQCWLCSKASGVPMLCSQQCG